MYIIVEGSSRVFTTGDMKHFNLLDERESPARMISLYEYARKTHGFVRNKLKKENYLEYVSGRKGEYKFTSSGLDYCAKMFNNTFGCFSDL